MTIIIMIIIMIMLITIIIIILSTIIIITTTIINIMIIIIIIMIIVIVKLVIIVLVLVLVLVIITAIRPVRLLRVWVSGGLTQADSSFSGVGILMSVESYRESPRKFDSRTLSRKTLNRWTGRMRLTRLTRLYV